MIYVALFGSFTFDCNLQCNDMMAYCMSKAAVAQLTRCAASELASKGIRVNAVCPGVIDSTRIFHNAGLSTEFHDLMIERVKATHPLGRAGTPEEVAKSIAFLASEEHASFMTGVTLPIDGGRCVSS
jgi:NAD(P)-dependent dehydrogenase (short-subunit alcohol dehydrogenase family)